MDAADAHSVFHRQSTWHLHRDTRQIPSYFNKNRIINDNNPVSADAEFSSLTDMEGGGGLNLFGVTSSFVNPGTLLSSAIASGVHQLSEMVNSIENMNHQEHQESPLSSISIHHHGQQPSSTPSPAAAQQFFGIVDGGNQQESEPSSSHPSAPFAKNVTSLAQFFGIANIYIDGINSSDNNSVPMKCPAPPQHVILTVSACHINTTAIGACSMTSAAEGGTIFVLYPTAAAISSHNVRRMSNLFKKKKKKNPPNNKRLFAGFASIGIMASDLNTKVSVTCPHISAGTTVTTQNGPVLPNEMREETGFVQLIISGAESQERVAAACEWKSSI
ncbi:hypothetical protein DAPPUDRAFT_118264 [Daphnia pulex]|uniref:Uncharacterized protein n=1 Tax=Daphnia pulex TaxID=6669 RepID=E9HV81_DAPPU|nr:hypothetical protein DAPPUDRAFT_118264 [Daphnia pulex]|eukprot:EFX64336.1 hypothetical protein DAPPUDRAFT_118264 [Daphnia pulex]